MKILFLLVLNIFLFSCIKISNTDAKQEENTTVIDSNIIIKEKIENAFNKLQNETGALIYSDTIHYFFTYDYQKLLDQNNIFLFSSFQINDIEKKDTCFVLSIQKAFFSDIYLDLLSSNKHAEKIYENYKINGITYRYVNNLIALIKINEIKKGKIDIDTEVEQNEGEEPTSNITIDASNIFFAKGQLIELYHLNNHYEFEKLVVN